ncbi:hypothetical protein DL93DRAFT_2087830 [Clavulina sp. PMI_390]|nr:hypothetical protein DL93DRAFT_2087830 [Clavulina sp. PMI_390]
MLHRAGISHKDVAKRNFLKSASGQIRLIDFADSDPHSQCPLHIEPSDSHLFPLPLAFQPSSATSLNEDTFESLVQAASKPFACRDLDGIRKRFGFCERNELRAVEWLKFVLWDGVPWGQPAPGSEGAPAPGAAAQLNTAEISDSDASATIAGDETGLGDNGSGELTPKATKAQFSISRLNGGTSESGGN